MPAKRNKAKKGVPLQQNQARKLQMQKIAKGGPQLSGTKGMAKAKPTASSDAKSWQRLNQSASAKAGKAAEAKPRTPAPGTGDVVKQAMQRGQAARAAATSAKMAKTLASARFARGPASAVASVLAEKTLGPLATKAGQKLGAAIKKAATPKKPEKAGPAAPARIANAPKAPKLPSPKETTAQAFDKAFKAARKDGKKEFTWRGKRYTTKMK